MKKAIESSRAPKPIGPYSQAVVASGLIFLSGLIPLRSDGNMEKGDIGSQFDTIVANASAILEEAGSSLDKVAKVTVFMSDLSEFGEMNEAYSRAFRHPYPARTTVQVAALPKGAHLEVDMIAQF
jgi:2-iminobutanoate/2-iminopropanoate deaminase